MPYPVIIKAYKKGLFLPRMLQKIVKSQNMTGDMPCTGVSATLVWQCIKVLVATNPHSYNSAKEASILYYSIMVDQEGTIAYKYSSP